MFAGAVRETVLANKANAELIKKSFIPVAVRAADLNNPGPNAEGSLLRSIARSKPLPQGLCVLNSSGQALAWVETFADDVSVRQFLQHCLDRFARNADGKVADRTERFMNYPHGRLSDVMEEPRERAASVILSMARGGATNSQGLIVRAVGRALDKSGHLQTDILEQEKYIEHEFAIPEPVLNQLASDLRTGRSRFELPHSISMLFIKNAFLGQLDLAPLSQIETKNHLQTCAFWATRTQPELYRIDGDSDVSLATNGYRSDGAGFSNHVTLHWTGWIKLEHDRIESLTMLARGTQQAFWHPSQVPACDWNRNTKLRNLPAGHPFDMNSPVVFGFEASNNLRSASK